MPILIEFVTTTPQIKDTSNKNGFGQVRIRPSQSFTYFDGVNTITVADVGQTIAVENGQLQSTLQLDPNTGASNLPETYYIVEIDVNGTLVKQFWQIDASSAPGPIEFGNADKLPTSADPDSQVQQLLDAQNPLPEYLSSLASQLQLYQTDLHLLT